MRITADAAREYFSHPTQIRKGGDPANLPAWAAYYAERGVCLLFHPMPSDGLWMVHIGVIPSAWGSVTGPARELMAEAWADLKMQRIVAWAPDTNRAVAALCKRIGFEIDGRLPLARPLTLYGWRL